MWWFQLWHYVLHLTGSDDVSGKWYGFWSGFGGDIGLIVAFFAVLLAFLRKHNCEVHGCWRMGRHMTYASHLVCRAHHPDDHLTAEDVRAANDAAKPV